MKRDVIADLGTFDYVEAKEKNVVLPGTFAPSNPGPPIMNMLGKPATAILR